MHLSRKFLIENSHKLPHKRVDRFVKPFSWFVSIQAAGGAVLLVAAIVAIIASNSPWADFFLSFWDMQIGVHFSTWVYAHPLQDWINDGLMTFFFFLVAVELKRELVLGELRDPRMAALSIFAALGGMVAPAALYLMLQWGKPGEQGWGTVMATDTAFVVCCLALLGKRVPHSLRVFMLSLAIVDDIGAILVVAIGYSSEIFWSAVAGFALGIIAIAVISRIGVRSFTPYFFLGGFSWFALEASGIHATVAGVVLGLMTPARRWVSDDRLYSILGQVIAHPAGNDHSGDTKDRATLIMAEVAARESLSAVERLQMALNPWVSFAILPLFALANAGTRLVAESFTHSVAWAVFIGFALGKPLGVFACGWLAVRLGIAKIPADLTWGMLAGGSVLTGIGFTMALLIADMAYEPALIEIAKSGILMASVFSAVAGITVLWVISRRMKK